MKLPAPSSIVAPLLLLACAGIVAACGGGGGGQSLGEYFQELNAVKDDFGAKADAVEQEFPAAFQESGATRDYLVETNSIVGEALDALRGMDPPEQVRPAHGEFVDALAASQELWEDLTDQLGDAPSPSDALEVSELLGPQLEATSAQFETACLALEAIAADNGIDVDLECEEE